MSGSTVNAAHGNAPGIPGTTAKATVTAGATSAATQIRAAAPANTYLLPALVNVKALTTTAAGAASGNGYHVVFGDASVGAPTDADMPIQDIDGWVTLTIPASVTHYRIKSDNAAAGPVGSVFVNLCG
jgi:hypothetical protein